MRLFRSRESRDLYPLEDDWRRVEGRQWWLSSSSIAVSLLLTFGIVSFILPAYISSSPSDFLYTDVTVQALIGLVLLFDLYVIFHQLQLYRVRKRSAVREELSRLIGEHAADMIAIVDVKGHRLYNSPSYEKILGYSQEELRSSSGLSQIHPDDQQKVIEASREAQRTGLGRRLEYRIRHKDGHWVSLESTASAIRNSAGEVEKLLIVNRDATERKRLEGQVLLAQKLEAIGKLSGGIAHDFNNVLGVIIGYCEELQSRLSADDANREAIDEIETAAKRAAALTQQLLAFSRKQAAAPTTLDLSVVVTEAAKMLGRLIGEDVVLEVFPALEPCLVLADRSQIERVIFNLAVNARDAMPEGGKFGVEVAPYESTEPIKTGPETLLPGRYALLKVSDTGCGMDADLRAHIFEPFFTTKEKGTGIGLSTVYGIVKQSGGFVRVESEPQKGTTFLIYFPRVAAAKRIEENPRPAAMANGANRTVLIVEDEKALLKLTRQAVGEMGFTVLEASDGFEAIEMATRCEKPIDLLLTDVIMPGMNGNAVADTLCHMQPNMKVLYMSGYSEVAIANRGLKSGIPILRKPFTRVELMQRVEEAFAESAPDVAEKELENPVAG